MKTFIALIKVVSGEVFGT